MAGFAYFIEGDRSSYSLSDLDSYGLRYAFDAPPQTRRALNGPGGKSGSVIARPGFTGHMGYFPEHQRWIEADSKQFWLAIDLEQPPSPVDLARDVQMPGTFVEMADGHEWLIPNARDFTEVNGEAVWFPLAPQKMQYKGGQWVAGDVLDKYRNLWEAACAAWDECTSAMAMGTDLLIAADCATVALAANYYVGVDEVSEMGLYTTTGPQLMGIVNALTGLDRYMRWAQKKMESSGPTT